MSCETTALASSTAAQTVTSLSPANTPSTRGSRPSTTRPSPRLSALVRRVQPGQRVGEAQQAGGAGEEEEPARADRGDREDVEQQAHSLLLFARCSGRCSGASAPGAPLTNATEAKSESSANVSATSMAAGTPLATREQQQGRHAARAHQLRGHHPVRVTGPAQNARQPERHHREHEHRRREQERGHRGDLRFGIHARAAQRRRPGLLFRFELLDDRLRNVEAVILDCFGLVRNRHRARHQAGNRRRTSYAADRAADPPDR